MMLLYQTTEKHFIYVMPVNPCKTSHGDVNRLQAKDMVLRGSPVETGQPCSVLNSPVCYGSFECKLAYDEHVDNEPH